MVYDKLQYRGGREYYTKSWNSIIQNHDSRNLQSSYSILTMSNGLFYTLLKVIMNFEWNL